VNTVLVMSHWIASKAVVYLSDSWVLKTDSGPYHTYCPTASVVQWSEFLATDAEVRGYIPSLPDFLRSSGSGMGSTQPRGYSRGAA
jgi:hypothetical protein